MANNKFKSKVQLDAGVVIPTEPANRALIVNATGDIVSSPVTSAELGQLSGATSGVVTLNGSQTLTNKTLTSPVINTPTGITKSDVGLSNVDNTSDATKNAASATLLNKTIDGATNTITNVSLTTGVTGTLPLSKGGTNNTALNASSVLFSDGTKITEDGAHFTYDPVSDVLEINKVQLGGTDPFGRNQLWNFRPNAILRLGSLASDGDPTTSSSEGSVMYGQNAQGDVMSSSDFGYARIKPMRFGLYNSKSAIADYIFKVDPTSLYLADNSFVKKFEVNRTTGNIKTSMSAGVVSSDASGNLTSGTIAGTSVTNTPAGNISSTTVQAAINELDSEKIASTEKGVANGVATLDAGALIPITQIPPAALERLIIVANQTARFALTTATAQNGDTVKQTDTGVMYFVIDDTNLGNASGYSVYTAGTASSVAWSGVTGTPTTLAGYGITDYAAAAKAAAVSDAIVNGVTDVAPSQNAVFDALALKADLSGATFSGAIFATNLSGTNTGDQSASTVANTPAGNISSTTVQAAINELDSEKQPTGNYITALTGEVTASGPGSASATVSNAAVIGKVLTGYASTTGTITAADTILTAIEKLNGNTPTTLDSLTDVVVPTPANGEILQFNGSNWINTPISNTSASQGVILFLDDTITVDAYNALTINAVTTTPTVTDTIVTAGASTVFGEGYLYQTAIGKTTIDSGIWEFDFYCDVSNAAGVSQLGYDLFRVITEPGTVTITGSGTSRTATITGGTPFVSGDANAVQRLSGYLQTAGGTFQISAFTSSSVVTIVTSAGYVNETAVSYTKHSYLFSATSDDINSTSTVLINTQSAQPSFVCNATDFLAMRVYAVTDAARTIHFYHNGTTTYSHVHTPLRSLHNDLAGLQGGSSTERYHLTAAQNTDVVNATNANTASTIVKRDSSGNFSAGTITANLTGNASGSAASFTGSLSGDVTGTQSSTAIAATVVTGKALTGFVSGSGTVSATDSILTAINKLDGNVNALVPISGDIGYTSFNAANNQSAATNVTGLAFANASVRSFKALVSVEINATASLYETFELQGIQKGASWDMSVTSVGDDSHVVFSITSAGQVQYTSGNETGYTSSKIKFRAQTLSF